jgi:hypothetical protein
MGAMDKFYTKKIQNIHNQNGGHGQILYQNYGQTFIQN